jgi:hypothetical protein
VLLNEIAQRRHGISLPRPDPETGGSLTDVLRLIGRTALFAVLATATAALAGCGFVSASNKSDTKPSAFVLIGHVTIALPATSTDAAGAACRAPAGTTDVAENTQVTVTDTAAHKLASGVLGAGVVARTADGAACQFPFAIRGVPGGSPIYEIAIGNRPAQPFEAGQLRTNTPAVITITPNA